VLHAFELFAVEHRIESTDEVFGSGHDVVVVALLSSYPGLDILDPNLDEFLNNIWIVIYLWEARDDGVTCRLSEAST